MPFYADELYGLTMGKTSDKRGTWFCLSDGPVYEALESGVNQLQEQLNTYLEQERAAMEERIRSGDTCYIPASLVVF